MRDDALDVCPVSYISAESAELARAWMLAKRQDIKLSAYLGDLESAYLEDVEDVFRLADSDLEYELAKSRNRNRQQIQFQSSAKPTHRTLPFPG